MGTKLRPLLRTDFSAFKSARFSGIVTTVWWFWFSRGAVLFFRGFVRFSSLCFLVCSKWWKSLELRAWILVWIDRSKTEGHTLESWELHSIICLFSSLRFEFVLKTQRTEQANSHNYLLHSSSHPQHVKNAIPFSQFLRLRRLCSDDTDFNNKCEEMCQFFKKRGYPDSAETTGKHPAQEIDRETALQTSQNEETDRIPFTLTYHPQNLTIKNVILRNFKILRNDPETKHIFSLPPLISFKRDKNLGNFLVRSAFKFDNQPGTFTWKRTRCKTCPFISNTVKISGPNRSVKVTDHFTCISTNVIYCTACTLCKKIYIGETGRRLADRFREHLRDVEKNNTDASKPVARHFNLPNHSHHNMTICGLSLHHGNTESRKHLEQKFIFQLGTLSPHGINERLSFH